MSGSGKSTVARKLAQNLGCIYRSGGDALKEVASNMGYETTAKGWWETEEGIRFLEERLKNFEIDRKVDEKLLEWAEQGDIILDSRVMPWLLKRGIKIWLEASLEVRAQRIAKRDNLTQEEALKFIKDKESKTRTIYAKLYGFNLGEDFEPFHLILDVNNLNKNDVFDALYMVVDNLVLKRTSKTHKPC
jgi:cytidylate kinase